MNKHCTLKYIGYKYIDQIISHFDDEKTRVLNKYTLKYTRWVDVMTGEWIFLDLYKDAKTKMCSSTQ